MPNHNALAVHRVFRALADPTRMAVLEQLSRREASLSELARPFAMALPSFAQHLDVLEDCGLVLSRKSGRSRIYRLSPRPLAMAGRWIETQHAKWRQRLDQLDSYLSTLKKDGS